MLQMDEVMHAQNICARKRETDTDRKRKMLLCYGNGIVHMTAAKYGNFWLDSHGHCQVGIGGTHQTDAALCLSGAHRRIKQGKKTSW